MEFEYDQKNTLYVRIDRKRKFLGTIFLRALGLRTDEEILKTFYTVDTINVKDGKLHWTVTRRRTSRRTCRARARPLPSRRQGRMRSSSATRQEDRRLRAQAHPRGTSIESVEVETSEFDGAMTAADVVDLTTGELLYEANQELTADKLHKILQSGVTIVRGLLPRARRRRQHHLQHAAPRLRAQA